MSLTVVFAPPSYAIASPVHSICCVPFVSLDPNIQLHDYFALQNSRDRVTIGHSRRSWKPSGILKSELLRVE